MDLRKAMRRGVPLLLLGTAATVVLRKRLQPRPALPPGDPSAAIHPSAEPVDVATTRATIAEHTAAVVATAAVTTAVEAPPVEAVSEQVESRFARRLRRAPVDIVTVVDDLLGAVR